MTAYIRSKAQAGRGSRFGIGPVSTASPVSITGTTTSSSTSVSSVSPTTGYSDGAPITGAGIPVGTTIVSGSGTATLVLSAAATASATVTLTVGPTYVRIGEIKSLAPGNGKFDTEDLSNFDSGLDKEYGKLMRDNGQPKISGNRDSSDAGQAAVDTAYDDGDNSYLFQIILRKRPDQSVVGDIYTFSALVVGRSFGPVETNKSIPYDVDLQITGPVTKVLGS